MPGVQAAVTGEHQPRLEVAFGEHPLPAQCKCQRRVQVGPCDAEFVPGLLRQFPAAVQLGQALHVAAAQLRGTDDVQRVPYGVQAPDPLGQLQRTFSPPEGLSVAHRYAQERRHRVVGAGQFWAGRKLLQYGHGLRQSRSRLGQGAVLPVLD